MPSNSENVESPVTITKEFVEEFLQKKITSLKVGKGSNPGDNFTSILFAIEVQVSGESEPLHLLLKTYPALQSRQKFLNETNLFLKEIKVYEEFIPHLAEFQQGKPANKVIKPAVPPYVAGKAIDFSKETDLEKMMSPFDNYLVMVDVRKTWGFQMVEKRIGLDFNHTALAIAELAKLHALSWAMKQKKNLESLLSAYPYLTEMCFSRMNSSIDNLVVSNFQLVENIAKTIFPPDSRALRGIEKLRNTGPVDVMLWFLSPDGVVQEDLIRKYLAGGAINYKAEVEEPWLVSCHGDSWVNNMLFRYNDPASKASPTEIMYVDLQLYREGCPTTDLAYMFYTSTTYETRKKHLNSLLKLYHDQFINYCSILGVEPLKNFTMETLIERFNRAKIFGFIAASMILPIILSSDSGKDLDTVKVEDCCEDEASFSEILKALTENSGTNPVLAHRFAEIISEMVESNVF